MRDDGAAMRWPRLPRNFYFTITALFLLLIWYYLFMHENVSEPHLSGHVGLGDYDTNLEQSELAAKIKHTTSASVLQPGGKILNQFIVPPNEVPAREKERKEDSPAVQAQTRTKLYCNDPGQVVTGTEGQVAPGYKLEHVTILIRHGDRSPIYSLPKYGVPQLPCHFNVTHLDPVMVNYVRTMQGILRREPLSSHARRFGLYPHSPLCEGAQLTGTGAHQHLQLGNHMQNAYIDRWSLLTGKDLYQKLMVVSTEYSRTYQSAMAFLYGFLPEFSFPKIQLRFTKNVQFCDKQHSGLECLCPLATKLRSIVEKEYHKRSANSSLHNSIKWDIAHTLGVPLGKLLWLGAIMDTMMGYGCHGIDFPCNNIRKNDCINWDLIGRLWHFMDSNGRSQVASYANVKMNRLLMHPLLHEILHRLTNVTHDVERTTVVLYSGHDVTVSPLAIALGIHDGQWPPYASRLNFELYSKIFKNGNKKYYLRILFNGEDRTQQVRFCKKLPLKDGVCPFENFQRYVIHEDMQAYGKSNYVQACSLY